MKIVIAAVLGLLVIASFYLTIRSVKRLKTDVFSFYPFDTFIPHGGGWSVGYFLLVIIALGLLIYFMIKGNFYYYLSPA